MGAHGKNQMKPTEIQIFLRSQKLRILGPKEYPIKAHRDGEILHLVF